MGMNTWEQGIAASSHVINARLPQAGNGPALTRVLRQRLTTPAGTGQEISKRWKSKYISIPCVDQDALFSSMQSAIMKFSSKQPKVMETLGQ
jgi:hypothetical protein